MHVIISLRKFVESSAKKLTQQQKDIRRAYVFAKVTAISTLCETIGHFVIGIALKTTSGKIPLHFAFILHLNVLPAVFLISTSENKNRVVEEGWLSVLRNWYRPISFPFFGLELFM